VPQGASFDAGRDEHRCTKALLAKIAIAVISAGGRSPQPFVALKVALSMVERQAFDAFRITPA
jgi:hypothetical protein